MHAEGGDVVISASRRLCQQRQPLISGPLPPAFILLYIFRLIVGHYKSTLAKMGALSGAFSAKKNDSVKKNESI